MTIPSSASRANEILRHQFHDRMAAALSRRVRAHPPVRLSDGSVARVVDLACAAGVEALDPLLARLAEAQERLDTIRVAAARLYELSTAENGADDLSLVDAMDQLRKALLA